METTKFKTTMKCGGCVAKATPVLNEELGEGKWDVDYSDPSKVLTVSGGFDKAKVIAAVEKAGFKAEELN